MSLVFGMSIPWGNEAEIFIIAISRGKRNFQYLKDWFSSWAKTYGGLGGRSPKIWRGGRPRHPSPQYLEK